MIKKQTSTTVVHDRDRDDLFQFSTAQGINSLNRPTHNSSHSPKVRYADPERPQTPATPEASTTQSFGFSSAKTPASATPVNGDSIRSREAPESLAGGENSSSNSPLAGTQDNGPASQKATKPRFRLSSLFHLSARTWIIAFVVFLLTTGGIGYAALRSYRAGQREIENTSLQTGEFTTQGVITIDLPEVSAETVSLLTNQDTVTINGILKVGETLVIQPNLRPTEAEVGQLYVDETDGQIYYFDGVTWSPVLTSEGAVTSITGTADQINVSASSGDVTLSLPQSIATTSSPTFAGLTLSGPLSTSSGGTGLSATATNGQILIGTGSGFALNTLTAGSGISITNSAGAITITGEPAASGGFIQGGNSFGALAQLGTNDNFGLAFETNGTERVRIDTAGRLGVGTNAPSAKVHILDAANDVEVRVETGTVGVNSDAILNLSTYETDSTRTAVRFQRRESGVNWYAGVLHNTGFAGREDFAITSTGDQLSDAQFVIQTGGNVGVGVVNPAAFKLQVAGSIGPNVTAVSDLGSDGLRFRDINLSRSVRIGTSGDESAFVYNTTSNLLLMQNTVDSTTGFQFIDADGGNPIINVDTQNERVGFGTAAPLALVDVRPQANEGGLLIRQAAGQTGNLFEIEDSLGNTLAVFDENGNLSIGDGSTGVIFTVGTGPEPFEVDGNGNIVNGTWQATPVGAQYGGTGQTGVAAGDILYGSGVNTWARRAIGDESECLIVTSGLPDWGSCATPQVTLQFAYNNGNTITTNTGDDILFTLADEVTTDASFLTNIASGSTGRFAVQNNGSDVLRIDSTDIRVAFHVLPTTNNNIDLGSDTLRYRDIFLGPGSVKIGASGDQSSISFDTTNDLLTFQNSVDSSNGFQFLDADGGTPVLRIDTAAEAVGIGLPIIEAPTNKLDVEGGVGIGAGFAGASSAPTNGLIVEGNVGIGTPSALARLVVQPSTNNSDGIYINSVSSGWSAFGLQLDGVSKGFIGVSRTADDVALGAAPSDVVIRTQGGSLIFNTNSGGASAVFITSSGLVGIGATPTTNLHVAGGARITGLSSCDTIDTDLDGVLVCGSDATGGGGGGVTNLQEAYEGGSTINITSSEGILAFTLSSADFTLTIPTGGDNFHSISRADGGGTSDPAQLFLLDNLDVDRAQPIALKIQSAAGGITTALDLSDSELLTALALGSNDVTVGGVTLSSSEMAALDGGITLSTETNGDYVATITAGSGISGTATGEGSTPTLALGNLTADWNQTGAFDIVLNNSGSELRVLESTGDTFFGTIDVGNLTDHRIYLLPDLNNPSDTFCFVDQGNCAGSGSGVTQSGANSAGQVAVFTADDDITGDTEFFWDTATNRLGIVTGGAPANFTLQVGGHIGPHADDQFDLGSSEFRFRDLYLGPASIHVGTDGDEGVISFNIGTDQFEINRDILITGQKRISAPGTGTNSEVFGGGASAGGGNSVALGSAAVADGSSSIAIGSGANASNADGIAIGHNALTTDVNQLVIGSSDTTVASIFVGNGVTNAAPQDITFNSTGGQGADIAGADIIIAGGRGTGTGLGGDIIIQTAQAAGGSSSSLNALTERLRVTQAGIITLGAPSSTDINDRLHLAGGRLRIDNDTSGVAGCFQFDGGSNALQWSNDCVSFQSFSSSSAGGWTDANTLVHLTSSGDNVTVGPNTDLAKLGVIGENANEVQFLVRGNATQTANLVVLETSAGTDLFNMSGTGAATFQNSTDSTAAFRILNASGAKGIKYDSTNDNFKPAAAPSNVEVSGNVISNLAASGAETNNFFAAAVGQDGLTYIVYGNDQVIISKCADPACTSFSATLTLDSTGGRAKSIVILPDGSPGVSYYHQAGGVLTDGDLMYARCNSPACTSSPGPQVIDTGGTGSSTQGCLGLSMALGKDGKPIMAYFNTPDCSTNGDLYVAKCSNASCNVQPTPVALVTSGNVGMFPSIQIPSDGIPVIAYDASAGLSVVKCAATDCSGGFSSNNLVAAGVGTFNRKTMVLINDVPYIAFNDFGPEDLVLYKCGDSICSSGNTGQIIEGVINTEYPSISAVEGVPAIAYLDDTNDDLKYVKCGNLSCTSWSAVTVDGDASAKGWFASLVMPSDGRPLIAYMDITNDRVYAAKCSDTTCSGQSVFVYEGTGLGDALSPYSNLFIRTINQGLDSPGIQLNDSHDFFANSLFAGFSRKVGINNTNPGNLLSINSATLADSAAQVLIGTDAAANKGLVIQGVVSQIGNLLEAQDSTGAVMTSISATGAAVFKNTINSTSALQVQTSTGGTVLNVDTSNQRVGVGILLPGTALDVAGRIRFDDDTTAGNTGCFRFFNAEVQYSNNCSDAIPSFQGFSASSGGGWTRDTGTPNIVRLTTPGDQVIIGSALNLSAKFAIDGQSDQFQLLVQGNATQTANLAIFENSAGTDLLTVSGTGAATFQNSANSTAAFRVLDSAGTKGIVVDTSADKLKPVADAVFSTSTQSTLTTTHGTPRAAAIGKDGLPIIGSGSTIARCSDRNCSALASANTTSGTTRRILVPSDGNPRVLTKVTNGTTGRDEVKYLRCNDPACASFNTFDIASGAGIDHGTWFYDMAMGNDGLPLIAYGSQQVIGEDQFITIIKCANLDCSSFSGGGTTIADASYFVGSVAMSTDGTGVVAYNAETTQTMRVFKCSNVTCTTGSSTTNITNGGDQYGMTIGSDGYPIIAFRNKDNNQANAEGIKVVHCTAADCSSREVSAALDSRTPDIATGLFSDSIKITQDGFALIAYTESQGNTLRAVKCRNLNCSQSTSIQLDGSFSVTNPYASIAIPDDGRPVIAYHNRIMKCAVSDCMQTSSIAWAGTGAGASSSYFSGLYTRTINQGIPVNESGKRPGLILDDNSNLISNLLFSSSAGYVGINNTSPANRLSVNVPTTADSAAQLLLGTDSAANKGLVIQGVVNQIGNLFEAQDSTGAKLVALEASGELGIGTGTATVDDKLHVIGQVRIDNDTNTTNRGCLRYASNQIEYSNDCASFQGFGVSAGGWNRDSGGVVRLTNVNDQVGIGTATPTAGTKLAVGHGFSGSGTSTILQASGPRTSAGSGDSHYGIESVPSYTNGGTLGTLYGIVSAPNNNGGGTVTNTYAGFFRVDNGGLFAVTNNATGIRVAAPTNTTGTIGNKYAITTEDLAGNIGLGTTAPNVNDRLHVMGRVRVDSGSGAGCFRYNTQLQWSDNCVDFLGFASAAAGGWNDAGAVVHLTDSTNTVGIGTTGTDAQLDIAGSTDKSAALRISSTVDRAANVHGLLLTPTLDPGSNNEAIGFFIHPTVVADSLTNVTTMRTISVATPTKSGTGTVTETTQLYIASPGYSGTDNYSIFSTGGRNFFAGQIETFGGLRVDGLTPPGIPTVLPQGTGGLTTWGYKITALNSIAGRGETLASLEGVTVLGNANLSGSNFNRITWPEVAGANQYRIYRTTAGGNPSSIGLVGTVTGLTFDDTGGSASSAVPTANTTGSLAFGVNELRARVDVDNGGMRVAGGAEFPITSNGAYLQWNRAGDGASWLINQAGAGSVPGIRFASSDTSNNVTEHARFDVNGRLGLGATTVDDKLHVIGQIRIDNNTDTATKGCFRFNSTAVQLEYSNNCSDWNSFANATGGGWIDADTVMHQVTPSDRIGIGTSTPSAGSKVHIVGDTALTGHTEILRLTGNRSSAGAGDNHIGITANPTYNNSGTLGGSLIGVHSLIANNGTGTVTNALAGYFRVDNASTGTITVATGVYVAAPVGSAGTITARNAFISEANAGDVGIGTTAPTAKLDVQGSVRAAGGLVLARLNIPQQPTVTPQGSGGVATYGYRITALSNLGETLASTEGTTLTGNGTLNGTNFNRITWPGVDGAKQYRIYRTTVLLGSPSSTGLIGTVGGYTTRFDDTGIAASGAVPTIDSSTRALIGGTTIVDSYGALTLQTAGTIGATSSPSEAQKGAYLIPMHEGNGFKTALGLGLFFNGTNWISEADGANNGGAAIASGIGSGNLEFFTVARTGTADQTISTSDLGTNHLRMTILAANGNVGIGTPNPDQRLTVRGATSDSTTTAFSVTKANDVTILHVRNDGRVGINQTDPQGALDVRGELSFFRGAGSADVLKIIENASSTVGAEFTSEGASNIKLLFKQTSDGVTQTQIGTRGDTFFNITTGNVGIADSTPTEAKLVVGGDIFVNTLATANSERLCWDGSGGSLITDCTGTPGDYAEDYGTFDETITAAEIVALDPSFTAVEFSRDGELGSKAWIEKASAANSNLMIGVVSTNPNEVIGQNFEAFENPRPVALNGRVPVKVNTENGSINPGDAITVSSTPGIGAKATSAGRVIGLALSSFDGVGTGSVLIFINPHYFVPSTNPADASVASDPNGQFDTLQVSGLATLGSLTVSGSATLNNLSAQNATINGVLKASEIEVAKITLKGPVIVAKDVGGRVKIPANASQLKYEFEKPYDRVPEVIVTPRANLGTNTYWVESTKTGFTIHLSSPLPSDVEFSYFVIQTQDPNQTATP